MVSQKDGFVTGSLSGHRWPRNRLPRRTLVPRLLSVVPKLRVRICRGSLVYPILGAVGGSMVWIAYRHNKN